MTTPNQDDPGSGPTDWPDTPVPPADPAYATPPPEGLPDADTQ
ncbi:hypothetical protein MYFR107205_21425 [Mycolicibacterium frederiksbergense]